MKITILVCLNILILTLGWGAFPAINYMDQVINRKKQILIKKCEKPKNTKGFMMIEVKVSPTGETTADLLSTDIKSQPFLSCALAVLNRTRFKPFSKYAVSRIYRFFIL